MTNNKSLRIITFTLLALILFAYNIIISYSIDIDTEQSIFANCDVPDVVSGQFILAPRIVPYELSQEIISDTLQLFGTQLTDREYPPPSAQLVALFVLFDNDYNITNISISFDSNSAQTYAGVHTNMHRVITESGQYIIAPPECGFWKISDDSMKNLIIKISDYNQTTRTSNDL
jgi:hypothetical protein